MPYTIKVRTIKGELGGRDFFDVSVFKGDRHLKGLSRYLFTEKQKEDYIASLRRREANLTKRKADRKAERATITNTYKVGDLFRNSWGYDQTNVDYYQVVRVSPKCVWIREIGCESVPGSDGFMSDRVVPKRDAFLNDKTMRKPLQAYGRYGSGIASEFGCMTKVEDGHAAYRSWYA